MDRYEIWFFNPVETKSRLYSELIDMPDDFEKITTDLQAEFDKLPPGERVRFFYAYAMLMLDETELRNLATLINERLPKT